MSTPATILFSLGTASPAAPNVNQILLYAKTDNQFYTMNASGTEILIGSGGGGGGSINGGIPSTVFTEPPIDGGIP